MTMQEFHDSLESDKQDPLLEALRRVQNDEEAASVLQEGEGDIMYWNWY
jgi:hypothetical protein